jgi:hypothetical protein
MTLVIQIALGIVLAVVILVYWRELLALGIFLVLIAVVAIGAWIVLKPNLDNINSGNFLVWAVTVGIVSLLAWAVMWLTEKAQKTRKSSLESTHSDESSGSAPPKA